MIKKVALLIVILLLASITCIASEKKEDEVKYEVTISVTYNAVSIAEATRISSEAIERHKTACKTRINIAKGDNFTGSITIPNGQLIYSN